MQLILPLLLLLPALFGGFVKLAARLLGYRGVTWLRGFRVGLGLPLVALFGGFVDLLLPKQLMPLMDPSGAASS